MKVNPAAFNAHKIITKSVESVKKLKVKSRRVSAVPNSALLIDIDNLHKVTKKEREKYLLSVVEAAGCTQVFASVRADQFSRYDFICRKLNITLAKAPLGKNGADLVLLAAAQALHLSGCSNFTVLSRDNAFSKLPGSVTVFEAEMLSEKLRARADKMISLKN